MSGLACPPTPVSDQQEKKPIDKSLPAQQSYEDLRSPPNEEEENKEPEVEVELQQEQKTPAKKSEPKEQEVVDVDESWY